MEYINYFDMLPIDSIILNAPKYNRIRELYRIYKAIGRYLNTSIMQYNRIEKWASLQKKSGTREVSGSEAMETEQIFSDIHFLLIAMDKCYKYEMKLYGELSFDSLSVEYQRLKSVAHDIRIMRNTLEHSEENLNNVIRNSDYNLPMEYADNNWSWLEYQLLSIKNGVITIKDKQLIFSVTMFNEIIHHYAIIKDAIQKQINLLTT